MARLILRFHHNLVLRFVKRFAICGLLLFLAVEVLLLLMLRINLTMNEQMTCTSIKSMISRLPSCVSSLVVGDAAAACYLLHLIDSNTAHFQNDVIAPELDGFMCANGFGSETVSRAANISVNGDSLKNCRGRNITIPTLDSTMTAPNSGLRYLLRFYERFSAVPTVQLRPTGSCLSATDPHRLRLASKDINYGMRILIRRYWTFHRKSMRSFIESRVRGESDESKVRFLLAHTNAGLGNQMQHMVSALLLAIFTRRVIVFQPASTEMWSTNAMCDLNPGSVIIVNTAADIDPLFESGPSSDWRTAFNEWHKTGLQLSPSLHTIYLDLLHGPLEPSIEALYDHADSFSFMDNVRWLHISSHQYYAPGLFLHPTYGSWMDMLFPERDVYPALVHELMVPGNAAWLRVMDTLNSIPQEFQAARRIALQLRVLEDDGPGSLHGSTMVDSLVDCLSKEPDMLEMGIPTVAFVISLRGDFLDRLTSISRPGIFFIQPSSETYQSFGSIQAVHAVAEIWIAALSSILLTTAFSTFGYQAAAFGRHIPLVLDLRANNGSLKSWGDSVGCQWSQTYEPCFHFPIRHWTGMELGRHGLAHCHDSKKGITLMRRNLNSVE